ncbi:MAG: DUF6492 family protein [Pseudomonadota bacterium]
MKLALVTPSFSRDYPLCVEMCRSVDTYETDGMEHIVVVPREDLGLFQPLAKGRRRVIAQEPHLPAMVRVPLPTVITLPGIGRKRLRKIWVTRRGQIVRGWIMQQLLKLSSDKMCDADGFVFTDSDVVFVRPFGHQTFVRDNRLALYHVPGALDHSMTEHRRWQDVACALIGIPPFPFDGDNFIGSIVTWRRDRLCDLQSAIERVAGRDYVSALLGEKALSEYVVYGVFATRVPGMDEGHFPLNQSLSHEDWSYDLATADGRTAFENGLEPHHIAVLMQSTNEWTMETRREMIARITARVDA